jgi:retron-type reverse transcriptase
LNQVVPEIFKISRVTPVYKSGVTTELGNYRPIAIISPFSKVLERLVYNQVFSFIEKQKIIFEYQFGFRKGHSTEHAILETIEYLKTAIDENKVTCAIFLDFSKAFDTIDHKILLDKMNSYGICRIAHEWFSSYISNRKQYVKVCETESSMKTMTCGVPQGSTLGPLPFLLKNTSI